MSRESYEAFRASAIERYAQANVDAGAGRTNAPPSARARPMTDLLPNGRHTPDIAISTRSTIRTAARRLARFSLHVTARTRNAHSFIYDLYVSEQYRRQGHGERALRAVEPIARSLGATDVGLHVFAYNGGAKDAV